MEENREVGAKEGNNLDLLSTVTATYPYINFQVNSLKCKLPEGRDFVFFIVLVTVSRIVLGL